MGLVDSIKRAYFSLEDQYYALLDKIQTKIPVYSLVDPVDKILPSFGIILALVIALLGVGLFSSLSGWSGGEKVSWSVSFNDGDGNPLEGVSVFLEKENSPVDSQLTSVAGKVTFSVSPGTYALRANKEDYEDFFQEVKIVSSKSQIFTLRSFSTAALQRALLIQDESQNIVGSLSPVSISLSFSCQSGNAPSSQTAYSGNITFLQPGDCISLSVTVSANGYLTKTQSIFGDTTLIVLQSSLALEPEQETENPAGGSVEVQVKDGKGLSVEQAQIKLYSVSVVGSNVLAAQTLSDPNGLGLLQGVSPGKHVVIVSKPGYKQTTSAEFQVNAGEKVSVSVTLVESSSKRKVFVKTLNNTNQLSLSGVSVSLFVQTVSGKYIAYDTFTTDTNGIVEEPLADFNGNTKLVVRHQNFVYAFLPNTGIVSEDASVPIPILLEPLQAANSNGTVPNAVVADVKVSDEVGLSVFNATANIYSPDANGVLVDTLNTNTLGVARFSNLPGGFTYQATAFTSVGDGLSVKLPGDEGKIIVLPVVLNVGNALVEVTVKNEQNSPIPDANVSIFSSADNALQAAGKTNAQGVVQLGVLTGQKVYVKVEKPTYLPFSSVSFDVLKNNTHKIQIQVSLTSATQQVDISLIKIYELRSAF